MIPARALPQFCIGRTGSDFFSSHKDLTVILTPFERFSSFSKAVDALYESIDIPFNVIVVEGNAPESVRRALEQREKKHKNITIIYSDHHLSIGAAINLATPHLNTKYAFIMDADVRIPAGTMTTMLQCAKEGDFGIICPDNYVVPHEIKMKSNDMSGERRTIKSLGVRTCLFMSQAAIQQIGKFDETMTPCTAGIDIRMAAEAAGISICAEMSACMERDQEELIWPIDASVHSFQWNQERIRQSFANLEKKWGIRLKMQDYSKWLERKKLDLNNSQSHFFLWTWLHAKLKKQVFKQDDMRSEGFVFSQAA